MQQRDATRTPSDLQAVISCPRFGLFRGAVENISAAGLFVRTRNVNICINAPVTLTLQVPDEANSFCEVAGVVMHQNRNGFGVRLVDVDDRCKQLLEDAMSASDIASMPGQLAI